MNEGIKPVREPEVVLPAVECQGLIFWPIPTFAGFEAAFGPSMDNYFALSALPDVPRQYTDEAESMFFGGVSVATVNKVIGSDVDLADALVAIKALLRSDEPATVVKITTVGYLLWVLAPETAEVRKEQT